MLESIALLHQIAVLEQPNWSPKKTNQFIREGDLEMADFDIQIKGGTIVDGTQVPRYRGDVWIKDGKVAQLGGRAPGFAKKVI